MTTDAVQNIGTVTVRAFVLRLGLLLVFWWILTDGSGGWAFGLPLSVLVSAISLRLTPPARYFPNATRLPGFIVYFLRQSLEAGWDVARRTLSRDMNLDPAILTVPLRLPQGAPTWWLMATISLLPGTLSVRIDNGSLEIHCLDARNDVADEIRTVESRLAVLFGLPSLDDGVRR